MNTAAHGCGSVPPPAKRCREFGRQCLEGALRRRYSRRGLGSTELLHIFLSNSPDDIKYGTSGRPVPGYRVRLVNEAGGDVPDGEVGELLVDAPSAGEGYWNQRSKSRRTFEGHWTRTGDKYVRDADGRYTFCGRSDDMFKVSGIWVSPFEVERAR